MTATTQAQPATAEKVSLTTLFLKFLRIGAISFGGGIVGYLQDLLVRETKWLTADEFLVTLEISQTVPGLNSVNMSVLVGSRLRGPMGALLAALGIILPGAIFVLGIGIAVIKAERPFPIAHAAVMGIAAGAVGMLAAITLRTGKKLFAKPFDLTVVILSFVLMSILKLELIVVLIVCGALGIFWYRPKKGRNV